MYIDGNERKREIKKETGERERGGKKQHKLHGEEERKEKRNREREK